MDRSMTGRALQHGVVLVALILDPLVILEVVVGHDASVELVVASAMSLGG